MTGGTTPISDEQRALQEQLERPNFEGHGNRECGEHRTVGPHRAWCYDCTEWCHPRPEMACKGCMVPTLQAEVERLTRERDHAIHERVTLAAAQAMFPMRTVEVRPTDAENVACGVCRAAVGEPCRVLLDPRYTRNPHAARRAAAAGLPFDPEGAQ